MLVLNTICQTSQIRLGGRDEDNIFGLKEAFSKIQSGERWLTKDGINRDINCIVQLD